MSTTSKVGPKYAGADWLESMMAGEKKKKAKLLNPLARKVADIVGQVWKGIYHVPGITKGDWYGCRGVQFRIDGDLTTYDADLLTNLVILCHDAAIRLEIEAVLEEIEDEDDPELNGSIARLDLFFSQRQRGGRFYEHHPTIEEAIVIARNLAGPDWNIAKADGPAGGGA